MWLLSGGRELARFLGGGFAFVFGMFLGCFCKRVMPAVEELVCGVQRVLGWFVRLMWSARAVANRKGRSA